MPTAARMSRLGAEKRPTACRFRRPLLGPMHPPCSLRCGQAEQGRPDLGHVGSVPPPQPLPPALRGRPFRLDEALSLGVSRKVLRGRRFRRLRRGVYAEASLPDDLATRADAVLLVLPDAATFSHQTSAALRGLPVPSDDLVHVTLPPDVPRPELVGVCCHQRPVCRLRLGGRPITEPAQNLVELAEHLAFVDLVVAGDTMLRRSMVSPEDLLPGAHTRARRRGRPISIRAAELVRPKVDSPMETRVRLLLVLGGLPEPEPGYVFATPTASGSPRSTSPTRHNGSRSNTTATSTGAPLVTGDKTSPRPTFELSAGA